MNMAEELKRIMQQNGAGSVKVYGPEEAREMLEAGQVTSVEKVHATSHAARVSMPPNYGRGHYGYAKASNGGLPRRTTGS